MSAYPLVSVVIVTRDRKEKLLRLLQTVADSNYPADSLEIVVVDNVSTDGTVQAVRHGFPNARIILQEMNLYSAGGRNVGAAAARGDLIFLVDDDNILDPDCIGTLVEAFVVRPKLGIAAPLMLAYPDAETVWCAGGIMSRWGMPTHLYGGRNRGVLVLPELIESVDYFPNAYMVRAAIFRQGIWHDTKNFPHNWNEQDFCARVRQAGYSLATVTKAMTWHDIGYHTRITRIGPDKTFDQARARVLYRRRYLRRPWQWLFFWGVLFPASTIYYLRVFAAQQEIKFSTLVQAYLRGTLVGLRQKL